MVSVDDVGSVEAITEDDYSADQNPVIIGGTESPLVADYSREGVNLHLNWESGEEVVVTNYFATAYPPALETSGGARLDGDLVSKLAGPGPMAQAQSSANDASPIGEITSLEGQVTVRHPDGTSGELVDGSSVFKGDILETGADGSFALQFLDETKLSLGENGRVVLDDLVYDGSGSSSFFGISLLQGVFSLVSGLIAKEDVDAVSIRTPVGTIGIRGTSWAGKILAIGEDTFFTLFSGAIVIANEAGSQLLNVVNQTVVVTSFSSAPSVPFLLSDKQLLDIYGRILEKIDSKYDDDEDFDPDAINPEAGGRFAGGNGSGAAFQAFEILQNTLGLRIGALLGSGDLLDATQIVLQELLGQVEELLFEEATLPVAIVEVSTVTATGTISLDGFSVVVLLDAPATQPITVFYSVLPVGGDGNEASDLSLIGDGSLTIPVGATEGRIFISILEDALVEQTEFFRIELTGAVNAVISPFFSGALLVIEDDDIGVLSLQPIVDDDTSTVSSGGPTVVADEDGIAQFKVVLDKALAPGVEVSVDYVISGTAVEGDDFIAPGIKTIVFSGGTDGLAAGAEVVIDILMQDDRMFEGDESFTITLLNASEKGEVDAQAHAFTVNIVDNEIPLSVSDEGRVAPLSEDPSQNSAEDQSLGLLGGSGELSSLTFDTVQTDFDALGLSSGGVPVLLTGLGTDMLVAMAGDIVIFTATLNDNGSYDVKILGPLDHPVGILAMMASSSPLEVQTMTIPLAVTVVDENGSEVQTTIFLNVVDDEPEAFDDAADVTEGMLVSGNVITEGDGIDDIGLDEALIAKVVHDVEGSTALTPNSEGDYVIRGSYGQLTLEADGSYEYLADTGLDNSAPLIDQFTYTLQDADGDSSTAVLTINVGDGLSPSVGSAENSVADEYDLAVGPAAASGTISIDFKGDGPGTLMLDTSLLPVVTSFGQPITYVLSADGQSIEGLVNPPSGPPVKIISLEIEMLDDGTGFEYEFSLMNYLDHEGPENLPLEFEFGFVIEDQDGSQENGSFSVSVDNEIPLSVSDEGRVTQVGEDPSQNSAEVQSLGLIGGSGELQSLTFDAVQTGFDALGLTSGGVSVSLSGLGTGLLEAKAGDVVIFTAALNDNGSYDVEILGPLDHPIENLMIPLAITVVDGNGTQVQTTIVLNVADDELEAFDDAADVTEGMLVSGNVITEGDGIDDIGLDEALIAKVVHDVEGSTALTPNSEGDYVIRGSYGQLTLEADGSYEYLADTGLDNSAPLIDQFTYTLQDADGDSSTAVLTINVGDGLSPSIGSAENSVADEYDLAVGPAAASGTISVDFKGDGPGTLMLDTSLLPVVTSFGQPITYVLSADGQSIEGRVVLGPGEIYPVLSLTLDEKSDGSGFNYTFSLVRDLDHEEPENPPLVFNFGFVVEDQDGSQAEGQFSVSVLNDGPLVAGDDIVITNTLDDIYIPQYAVLFNDIEIDDDQLQVESVTPNAELNGDSVLIAGANRVENGSFENLGDGTNINVQNGGWATYNNLPGWMVDLNGSNAPIEVQFGGTGGVNAQDGNNKLELDSQDEGPYTQSNTHIYQDIPTESGEMLTLSFWYSPRTSNATDDVEVYWGGALLTTLSGVVPGWQEFSFEMEAGEGGTTRLEFRGSSTEDTIGGFIDNVYVGERSFEYGVSDGIRSDTGEVIVQYQSGRYLDGGEGSEIIIGSDNADTISDGEGDDIIFGGKGDDLMYGGEGADIYGYKNVSDGNDEIFDFDETLDVINLDALFDALDIDGEESRADLVNLTSSGAGTVITIDGQDSFSITLRNIDLGMSDGDLSAEDLMALKGILVGDES